jgi:hypothetical protein
MSEVPAHGVPVLAAPLVQPDRRSCGAAVLVVARMWHDADVADAVLAEGQFADEVLETHRRVTGAVDARGRLQLPWPRALGTPPWAVAGALPGPGGSGPAGPSYRTGVVWPWRRRRSLGAVADAVAAGHTIPVYVGSRWLPRHVQLAVSTRDDGLGVYDPAIGRVVTVTGRDFVAGRLQGRWTMPWFVVLPV